MTIYAYVVKKDFGSAPNIADGCLTLATCKPMIRKGAVHGDFIIGFQQKRAIYTCRVDAKMSWPEYVRLCESSMPDKIRSPFNPLSDCYLTENGDRREESDADYHSKPGLTKRDLSGPVILSNTFEHFGGKETPAYTCNKCEPAWLAPLVKEWSADSRCWRGHRKLCDRRFPLSKAALTDGKLFENKL